MFVLIGIATGILGVRAVVLMVNGKKNAYRAALIALLLGIAINAIHVLASRALRGGSMPVDAVLYTNVLTLVILLFFHIPGIRQSVNFEKPASDKQTNNEAAAFAIGVVGLLMLTIQFLMAPTHTIGGIKYADVWHGTLSIFGASIILIGFLIALPPVATTAHREVLIQTDK